MYIKYVDDHITPLNKKTHSEQNMAPFPTYSNTTNVITVQ